MILDQLAAHARERVTADKRLVPPAELRERASSLPRGDFRFESALRTPELSVICEVKRASPSKGIIDPVFDYAAIARDYQAAGADCVSCLTEPKWFLGSDEIFAQVRQIVTCPMIRKDFTVDDYQIDQAKTMGADAVLLICAISDANTLARYLTLCEDLGLTALVEAHDAAEIAMAVSAGARVIGVNNRNLKDFTVDLGNAARMRDLIPPEAVFVAESGVASPADAAALRAAGADAVLVGEYLMRQSDKAAALRALKGN